MPSLDDLHREARLLERAHRKGDEDAIARVAPWRPDARKPLKDAGAQMVVAREHGFGSWAKLREWVERHPGEYAFHTDMEYYESRAAGLLASALDGTPSASAAFEAEGAELDEAGARVVVARRHGFPSWSSLGRHVRALDESGDPFRRAYVALESGDVDGLREVLRLFSELARASGTNGNALINMASQTDMMTLLLDAGAEVDHPNTHGWTPLHQAAYGDRVDLAELLLERGAPADVSARGAGGTPLVVALFWGHRAVVDVLLRAGRHPDNLRVAAGTGDVGRIRALVPSPGAPTEAAGALRGFYRPHGGFPAWQPSDDPREILDEALSWAARAGRVEAIEALVALGADVAADVYRGTALTWAAAVDRPEAIAALLALGADVDQRATFGGPDHGVGVTALQIAAQAGNVASVDALLAAGADPSLRDDLYGGTAAGWAHQGGHVALAERLDGLAEKR